jgi:ABC-2 type transport system ATP-binding protein
VQRLAIACALVHRPELIFLDEPTAALDPQARRNLWDVIRAVRAEGVTVVVTTHYLDEAETLCDRVAIMDAGRILALDAPATLVRGLDVPLRILLDRRVVSAESLAGLPGRMPWPTTAPQECTR